MRCLDGISQRYPPLGCALLSAAALSLSIRSATTCRFLSISYAANAPNEDGFIISDSSTNPNETENINEMDQFRIGILCPSQYFSREDDLMWNLSRYFIFASFALLGISLIYSWGLSTCFHPSYCNWKILSVVSIVAAGAQIPSFLMFASEPCQRSNARCTSSEGFFMLLWSIILLVVITLFTQWFDYPTWRAEMERWKVKERDIPIYDYEDSYFDTECKEPSTDERNGIFQSLFSFKKTKQQSFQKDQREESIVDDHMEQLKLRSRKKKHVDVDFYMLNSDIENASQCLSGMGLDMPIVEKDMQDEDLVQEVGESLIPDKECKLYNEEWGEKIRAMDLERAASESSKLLSTSKHSPGRTKVLRKRGSHVSYFVLEDERAGESRSGDYGGGADYGGDDDDDDEKESFYYNKTEKSPIRTSSSLDDSHYDLELNEYTSYDMMDVGKETDSQSMVSSVAEDRVQIVDLSTGIREMIVVDNEKYDDGDENGDDTNEFDAKSFPPPSKKISHPPPLPVVSDNEDSENDDSLDGSKVVNQEMHQDLDEVKTNSFPHFPFVIGDVTSSGTFMNDCIKDDVDVLPNNENHNEYLTLPFHKRTDVHNEVNYFPIRRSHSTGSRWLDVLDKTVDKDTDRHVIKYQESDDLDDENDHLEMMMALRNRSSSLQTGKTSQKAHHVTIDPPNIFHESAHSIYEEDDEDGVLVSDDENEVSLRVLNTRRRSTLFPDEVEV